MNCLKQRIYMDSEDLSYCYRVFYTGCIFRNTVILTIQKTKNHVTGAVYKEVLK